MHTAMTSDDGDVDDVRVRSHATIPPREKAPWLSRPPGLLFETGGTTIGCVRGTMLRTAI